jgi:hypothetical protein
MIVLAWATVIITALTLVQNVSTIYRKKPKGQDRTIAGIAIVLTLPAFFLGLAVIAR